MVLLLNTKNISRQNLSARDRKLSLSLFQAAHYYFITLEEDGRNSISHCDGCLSRVVRHYLQHQCMGRMHKNGGVVLGGGLEAELGICGARVVGEGDAGGQFAVV